MTFDFDPIYLIYVLVAASAGLAVEGIYLLCFSDASYRKNVNRRLKLLKDTPDRENMLMQLRRERGLTRGGGYSLSFININQLVLQSGLTWGIKKLLLLIVVLTMAGFGGGVVWRNNLVEAFGLALFCGVVLPYLGLRIKRGRRQKAFGAQF